MEHPPHRMKSTGPTIRVDGRYARGKLIGRGGSGSVYEATQLSVNRKVALKVLNPRHQSETYRIRFQREAHAIASLNHPNIVTLFDYGHDEDLDYLYMAMEYAEGETLGRKLKAHQLSVNEIVRYGIEITAALDHAHAAGVLHRDLKPGNVIVTSNDEIKILDFGMAGLMGVDDDQRITREGAIYGTPPYMSPEQCGGSLKVSPASDLYTFGIMLFEMLEGHLPFEAPNVVDILVKHTTETAPPITNPDAPMELVLLVENLLRKMPSDRAQSAKVVQQKLESIASVVARRGHVSTPIRNHYSASVQPAAKSSQSLTTYENDSTPDLKWGLAAAAAIIFAAFSYVALSSSESPTQEPKELPPISTSDSPSGNENPVEIAVDNQASPKVHVTTDAIDVTRLHISQAVMIGSDLSTKPVVEPTDLRPPKPKSNSLRQARKPVESPPSTKPEPLKTIKFTY